MWNKTRKNFFQLSILASALVIATGFARPLVPLEESVYVKDNNLKYYSMLKTQSNFVIDHRKNTGFELYGPRGMTKFLQSNHVPYLILNSEKNLVAAREYPSFPQVEQKLQEIATKYPNITKLFTVGTSVKGRGLYFLKIAKNPQLDAHLPEFKYISSMHGDEITGRELMIKLIEDICVGYGKNESITAMVDNTEIFIMPSMNPDGSEMRQRFNANSADLNRDFPDFTSDPTNTPAGRQTETAAIMKFQEERNFSLSANFHGGAEVVNYPWDTTDELHPFDSLLQELSLSYAKLAHYIFSSPEFKNGITNGFTWYEVNGGMQDWSEFYYHDLQFTVELSTTKWPNFKEIPNFYSNNKASLLQFIRNIHQGAGFYFKDTQATGTVEISKAGHPLANFNFTHGEFYRVLEPGIYDFKVKGPSGEVTFTQAVKANEITQGGNYKALN